MRIRKPPKPTHCGLKHAEQETVADALVVVTLDRLTVEGRLLALKFGCVVLLTTISVAVAVIDAYRIKQRAKMYFITWCR